MNDIGAVAELEAKKLPPTNEQNKVYIADLPKTPIREYDNQHGEIVNMGSGYFRRNVNYNGI